MEQQHRDAIKKIVQFAKHNSEFADELRKALGGVAPSTVINTTSNGDVKEIKKYLSLDYDVDGQPSLIDYSFISETVVQNQLISDNREMMRFRYGTRGHKINFEEYCRYAHLQVEMLLNYFYHKNNDGNFDKIKVHIKKFNTNANITDAKSLITIHYKTKLWAFTNEFKIDLLDKIVLENICYIRNNQSHRSPDEKEQKIQEWHKQLIGMKMPLSEDGYVATSKLKNNSTESTLYSNMIKGTDWYKEYCFLTWCHHTPFDSVKKVVELVCSVIQNNI